MASKQVTMTGLLLPAMKEFALCCTVEDVTCAAASMVTIISLSHCISMLLNRLENLFVLPCALTPFSSSDTFVAARTTVGPLMGSVLSISAMDRMEKVLRCFFTDGPSMATDTHSKRNKSLAELADGNSFLIARNK